MWTHYAAPIAHDHLQRLNRLDPPSDPAARRRHDSQRYELHFVALFDHGRGLGFPCDARGNVDLDTLSGRARANYFYARATVGREFGYPVARRVVDAPAQ